MTSVFPSLDSAEFGAAVQGVIRDTSTLEDLYDANSVFRSAAPIIIEANLAERTITGLNDLMEKVNLIRAYIHAHVSTNSRDDKALAKASELDPLMARVGKLMKRLSGWIGSADTELLLASSATMREHEFYVRTSMVAAAHQMEPDLEDLASDLEITGSTAWQRLYQKVTSQLVVEVHGDRLPMSAVRTMASDPDRSTRRCAYEAELEGWKTVSVTLASALNCIKGESLELSHRRGWDSPLDATLFNANIDRQTLDAMMGAARRAFVDFRRYLNVKARALGLPTLAWYDLSAPLPGVNRKWDYAEGSQFVCDQFSTYSTRLAKFAQRAMREEWIDAEPRPGKVDGAFCMGIIRDESRVLLNYSQSFNSVSTLAHELGHGYHNLCLCGRTPIQRFTPMTLAETASIFCETIVRNAVLRNGTDAEKLEVLQASLQGSCQVVVDISSRFLFEQQVLERRSKRELSPDELCDIMLETQRETYGEGLDPDLLHGYMWASKPHYYGRNYYNFPYMFGLLFGLGLFAIYEKEGQEFMTRYDELLSMTGTADAATLAERFGFDIRSEAFWEASFDRIRGDIDLFERLTA
jgi:pepF/M3 family oligoendopeptidase